MKEITVQLPDTLYQRTRQFAELHQQEMGDAISALIEDALTIAEGKANGVGQLKSETNLDRERDAYLALHPKLKEQHLGKFVAIYQGELIDWDNDAATLARRIRAKYPDNFVWMTQVQQEPMRTIVVRSPRLTRDNAQ
jgi:methionyl-tRNA formyltransferase